MEEDPSLFMRSLDFRLEFVKCVKGHVLRYEHSDCCLVDPSDKYVVLPLIAS
jgi:hypothetical protein